MADLVLCRCITDISRRSRMGLRIRAFWAEWYVSFNLLDVTLDMLLVACIIHGKNLLVGCRSNSGGVSSYRRLLKICC